VSKRARFHISTVFFLVAISIAKAGVVDFPDEFSRLDILIAPMDHRTREARRGLDAPGMPARICRLDAMKKTGILETVAFFNQEEIYRLRTSPDRRLIVITMSGKYIDSGNRYLGKFIVRTQALQGVGILPDSEEHSFALSDSFVSENGHYAIMYLYTTRSELDRRVRAKTDEEKHEVRDETGTRLVAMDPFTSELTPKALADWNSIDSGLEISVNGGIHFVAKGLNSTPVTVAPPPEMLGGVGRLILYLNDHRFLLLKADTGAFFLQDKSIHHWTKIENPIQFEEDHVIDRYLVRREIQADNLTENTVWHLDDLETGNARVFSVRTRPATHDEDAQFGRILMVTSSYVLATELNDLVYIPRDVQGEILPKNHWKVLITHPDVPHIQVAFFGPETPPPPRIYPDDRPLTQEELEKLSQKEAPKVK